LPEIVVVAESAEDEARLWLWLGSSATLELLAEYLPHLAGPRGQA
jgi:hypothetical protein